VRGSKSFDDFAEFLGTPKHLIGAWFSLDEAILITDRGRRFSNKVGRRNAVLALVFGPNSRIFPRSTKANYGGFEHPSHDHLPRSQSALSCRVNKLGYVALDVPLIVLASELTDQVFACYEEDGSSLMNELQNLGDL